MKKTYRKVKQFVNDHNDGITAVGCYTLAAVASISVLAVAVWAAQKEAEQQKELGDWTREQNFAGKAVYELADGSYIAVSKDQVS